MSRAYLPEHLDAFLHGLGACHRELVRLRAIEGRLFAETVDTDWLASLDDLPERGERLEAFLSKFTRIQDLLGDKVLPRLRLLLAEQPVPALDALNQAERLGWIPSVDRWLQLRNLRNALAHDYLDLPDEMLAAIHAVRSGISELAAAYNGLRDQAERSGVPAGQLPSALPLQP